MINSLFYHQPIWVWGSLLVALVVAIISVALIGAQRFLMYKHFSVLKEHIDVGAIYMTGISSVFTVLIALLVFNVLDSYAQVDDNVQAEANCVGDLYRDARSLPIDMMQSIQSLLMQYLDEVIEKEWPSQKNGSLASVKNAGWNTLNQIQDVISTYNAPTLSAAVIYTEIFHRLNKLFDLRRSRVASSQTSMPTVVWGIIIAGGIVFFLSCLLLGAENFVMKWLFTILMFVSITLVVILIIALDRPFQGQLGIGSDEFIIVKHNIQLLSPRS